MARKNAQNDESGDAAGQNNTGKRNPLMYVAIIGIVVMVIAIAYFELSGGLGRQSLSSKQIFSNVSSMNLNQTQALFVNDLEKSENVGNLYVSYYSSNATQYITESGNLTIVISSNQTIDSYKLGNYNRTSITGILAYTNARNGEVMAKNVSGTYYYNTNTTLTCFNGTTYSAGLVTNSSLQCGSGDQGMSFIEATPYTAVNVSSLSYLVFNSTVSYTGTKTIAGRGCDNFIISNATASNLQSNYSIFNICLDNQYGIPLYLNQTVVSGGIPSSFAVTATAVSANASSSEFVIPQQYLNAIPKSII
ncbi:MAG: hypothetical protein ABSE71_04005 [Candidatus Micrarchaeaceae archaeon]|jgi:hypothetical protein|nr:hypothetical protein [Candidatus Micrarchaeota archaeon]HII10331.1 hypothetical protein [Candidatus Micrarchaeota archaeon]